MTIVRPEITGRRVAFSISEFCERNGISRSKYHKLKRDGRGPAEMRDGRIVRITLESELAWHKSLTHPTGQLAELRASDEAATRDRGRNAGRLAAQSPRHVSKRKRQSA